MQVPNTNQQLSSHTIKYGDVLNRASYYIYWDLQKLLNSFHDQDPELRTIALRKYFNLVKKRLLQQLALTKWLATANIIQFNTSLDQFHLGMTELGNTLEMSIYEIFCLHSQLYSMRTLKYETELACVILSKGTYPSLPTSVTRGGIPLFPKLLPKEELIDRLTLTTKSKLALKERIPRIYPYLSFTFQDGRLIIQNHYYYELIIILEIESIDSPWQVVRFRMQQTSVQGKLMMKQSEEASNNSMDQEIKEHHNKHKQHLERAVLQAVQKEEMKHSMLLMIGVCEKYCMNFRLRQIYISWLKFARQSTLFKQHFEIKLVEQVDEHQIQIYFWKSAASFSGSSLEVSKLTLSSNVFQFLIHIYVAENSDTGGNDESNKVKEKRLPYIATDILIPLQSWKGKGLEQEIAMHDLVGASAPPEEVYSLFAIYFTDKKLKFLETRLFDTLSSPSARGTFLENARISRIYDSIYIYPALAAQSDPDTEPLIFIRIQIDSRHGRYVLANEGFSDFISSCRTNLSRFDDELNDLENESYFLSYFQEHYQQQLQKEEVNPSNGRNQLLHLPPFSTLVMVLESMQLIQQCKGYQYLLEYCHDEERMQLQSFVNYSNQTFIVWRLKYWYGKNVYNQKYQMMNNEIIKIEEEAKKRAADMPASSQPETRPASAALAPTTAPVRKAPFKLPPTDDNILQKKPNPKRQQNNQQLLSQKNELSQEMYVLYMIITLSSAVLSSNSNTQDNTVGNDTANALGSSSTSSVNVPMQYDLYLCKVESPPMVLSSNTKTNHKLNITVIDRKLFQLDKLLQSMDLSHPSQIQILLNSYESTWILPKLKLDYLPFPLDVLESLTISSDQLPAHLNYLQVEVDQENNLYQCYDHQHRLLSIYYFHKNTCVISLYTSDASQHLMKVKDPKRRKDVLFNLLSPLLKDGSVCYATIRMDFFRILNSNKIKDGIFLRAFIQKLFLHFIPRTSTIKAATRPESQAVVSKYSNHWMNFFTIEEKIYVHVVRFLELLVKKLPLKIELENSLLLSVEAIRGVIYALWMFLVYSEYADKGVYGLIVQHSVKYVLRPMTVTIGPSDLPMILLAVDKFTTSVSATTNDIADSAQNDDAIKNVTVELHSFRYFTYYFEENAIIFLDVNYSRTNTFPIKDINEENIPNIINSIN